MSNNEQPIYLLAGGRGKTLQASMNNLRNIINSTGKPKPVVAFVGAASMKDNWLVYVLISTFIKAGCNCRIKRVLIAPRNADLDKARETLRNADVIFISGGDVEIGMRVLQEKNMVAFFQDLAKQGKLFLGMSAGSIMIGKEWVRWQDPDDDATAELFPCLGLVPLICDTHAEGDDWVELKTALKLAGEGTIGYGITSGAILKAYPDGRLEAEAGPVMRYKSVNGLIERLADL